MPSAFPYRTPTDHTPCERTIVCADSENPSDLLQTVSSQTAQQVLATLNNGPATVSDIAEAIGTSIQNAKYHVNRLCKADLIEPVDTWYSEKGTEMTVYALSVKELVVQFGTSASET